MEVTIYRHARTVEDRRRQAVRLGLTLRELYSAYARRSTWTRRRPVTGNGARR